MPDLKSKDYTGYSELSINEALDDALQKAEEHSRFEVIETISSNFSDNKRQYQVTLTTFVD